MLVVVLVVVVVVVVGGGGGGVGGAGVVVGVCRTVSVRVRSKHPMVLPWTRLCYGRLKTRIRLRLYRHGEGRALSLAFHCLLTAFPWPSTVLSLPSLLDFSLPSGEAGWHTLIGEALVTPAEVIGAGLTGRDQQLFAPGKNDLRSAVDPLLSFCDVACC